jgi:hypothetical protein
MEPKMETKECRECGKEKEIDEYYVNLEMKDGHLNKCKECVKERIRRYREKNEERIREVDKSAYENKKKKPDYHAKETARRKKWRTAEKLKAHNVVAKFLKKNRPVLCEMCETNKAEQAHHPDYSNPFRIVWACPRCHVRLHLKRGFSF